MKIKLGKMKRMAVTDNNDYRTPLLPASMLPVSATSSIVHDNGKVLLILRGKHPNKGMWSLPGGRQNLGESLKHAAMRELKEETSLIAESAYFATLHEFISHASNGNLEHHVNIAVFRVDVFSGSPIAGDDAADIMWASREELNGLNLTPDTARIIIESLGDLSS